MPPSHQYTSSQSFPRHSILPSTTGAGSTAGSASMSAAKTRQYAHLHSQLAQLNAHLADTENLLRMTAVQAQDMRFLGGYVGALFMGSAKVLGEEGVKGNADEGSKARQAARDDEEMHMKMES
ncbi:DASH complex subunit Hsk3 like-domain-containing protein [Aspergillus ambiguus]|uniref:DASH complex subunit HSK3 family protein n=1 Tax=Aspergillus ambiguus TaxID=176160 RepID=UPI003CCC9846